MSVPKEQPRCDACESPIGFIARFMNQLGETKFLHDTCVGGYLMANHEDVLTFHPGEHDGVKVIDLMVALQVSLAAQKLERLEKATQTQEVVLPETKAKLEKLRKIVTPNVVEEDDGELTFFTGPKLMIE